MALFKAVKKPVIRQTSSSEDRDTGKRPRYAPKASPCGNDCPIGCDIRGMLTTIADAELDGKTPEHALEVAWQRMTARNPFPSACGRLCSHPCESNCHRSLLEGPVAVTAVERFVGDYAVEHNLKFTPAKQSQTAVAVTGSGPAGLTAAYHLARRGYKVTVLESSAQTGGIMRSNVPDQILDAEIQRILELGVELKCGCADVSGDYAAVVETASLDSSDTSAIAVAIAGGLSAAEAADAKIKGVAVTAPAARPLVPADRIRPEWYKAQPRFQGGEMTADSVVIESKRCMSCGMCMGCGNCWSYCTKHGFEKVASGRRYKLTLERCNGCGKCADGCPSGYIDLV